jgi:hypothetical protein
VQILAPRSSRRHRVGRRQRLLDTTARSSLPRRHWNEDQLQWNHGESQQEHEFYEGYLEFEMPDSQLFARIGKQLVIWGKTELFRNQDHNNPLDIGNGKPGPRRGVGSGRSTSRSPEAFMRVGPVEDLRLELLWIMNQFTPTDLESAVRARPSTDLPEASAQWPRAGRDRPSRRDAAHQGLPRARDLRLRRASRVAPLHVLGLRLLGLRRRLHPR